MQLERLRPAAARPPYALPPIVDDEQGREEDGGTSHFDTLSQKSLLSDDGRMTYTNRSEYGPPSVADDVEGGTSDGDISARSEDGSVQ